MTSRCNRFLRIAVWWSSVLSTIAAGGDLFAQGPPYRDTGPRTAAPRGTHLPPQFQTRTLNTGEPVPRQYVVFVPEHYDKAKAWPVILFLHGSGECGYNDRRSATVGLGPYIRLHRLQDFPFITLFPQVSEMWFRGRNEQWVWQMLDAVTREFHVNPDRIYLTGMSMGGFGAWDLAMRRPDVFAAVVPICGGAAEPDLLANLRGLPFWVFHGAQDDRVPVTNSRLLVEALEKDGQDPKYTEFPELGHFCWDRVFAMDELYTWLLSHKRRPQPTEFTYKLPMQNLSLPWRVWWFQFDQIDGGTNDIGMSTRLDEGNVLKLLTSGVRRATLVGSQLPILREDDLSVVWNGRRRFVGKVQGDLVLRRKKDAPDPAASQAGALAPPKRIGPMQERLRGNAGKEAGKSEGGADSSASAPTGRQ